ncbi:MAG: sel1 repeat family protein [Alphaproteobacteria bacterium]
MRLFPIVFLAMVSLVSASLADTFQDAETALERGDFAAARPAFERLAAQGHPGSQFRLGYLHRNGLGGRKDLEAAAHWYRRAAVQGHVQAQRSLAVALELGRGLARDPEEASIWYHRAAENDDGYAQRWLGDAYLRGTESIGGDPTRAYFWYRLAAYHDPGCPAIADGLKESGASLTARQRQDLDAKADDWRNDRDFGRD